MKANGNRAMSKREKERSERLSDDLVILDVPY
jgi:hypothetical protein